MADDEFDHLYGAVIEDILKQIKHATAGIAEAIVPDENRLNAAHKLLTGLISRGAKLKKERGDEWYDGLEHEHSALIHVYLPLLEMMMRTQRDIMQVQPAFIEHMRRTGAYNE